MPGGFLGQMHMGGRGMVWKELGRVRVYGRRPGDDGGNSVILARKVIRRIGNWSNVLSCEVQALLRCISFAGYGVLEKGSLDATAKITCAKLNKRSRDADLSKDMLGPESQPELLRSWCVEGHIEFRVISSVLTQYYLRTIQQRYSPYEGPPSLE
uniref:Uncharacterized protein n=1 Tax=Tanacetum cinerariifolium TaxID=118510 RepID=A0A6L2LSZ0_TANCI|nr:hypothetical protein [Tanacetum cinerariifolium]